MMSREQCRYCVACLAFYYPLFLLATFVVDMLPSLLRSVTQGHSLDRIEAGLRGFSAKSAAPNSASIGRTATSNIVTAVALLLLLAFVPSRLRPVTGLFLAITGTLGAFWWIFLRRPPPPHLWHEAVYLPVLFAGLWFHVRAIQCAWWNRVAAVLLVFVLPATITHMLGRRGFGVPLQFLFFLAAPALLAGLLSVLVTWKKQSGVHLHSWKPALAGFLVTAVTATGLGANDRMRVVSEQERQSQLLAKAEAARPPADSSRIFFQKGVNFTSEGWAHYGAETSLKTLRAVHDRGVDSIALVPYGGSSATEPRIGYGNNTMESDEGIIILTAAAHELGMKVMLKPQMWVHPGGFPGAIRMPDAASTRQWFEQYAGFSDYYAKLAPPAPADLYCIGTEFVHMSKHTDEWRKLIAKAREIYKGPIVYAATQGPEFENLAFWDDLDYIGLNNYYPLPDDFSTAELIRKVEAVQSKYRKPVLLTEAGYVSMEWPNRAPWDETPRKLSMEHQAKAYEAIYKAFWDKPWFAGVYWWRVGSNGEGGPEDGHHTPWGKPAMDVVTRYYTQSGQARSVAIR